MYSNIIDKIQNIFEVFSGSHLGVCIEAGHPCRAHVYFYDLILELYQAATVQVHIFTTEILQL